MSVSVCLFLSVLTCLNEPNCVSEYGGSGGSLAFLSQKSHLTLLKSLSAGGSYFESATLGRGRLI